MDIDFINILEVNDEIQSEIRNWRNSEDVKKYMYTDHDISLSEHKTWINSLKETQKNRVFVVFRDKNSIGIVSLNNINHTHKTSDWAYYLCSKDIRGQGLGALIEYKLLNYFFFELNFDKLNCEVLEINPTVIKLHKKFGFKEEGIKRKNIIKNGVRLDVILLGILKDEWVENKKEFEENYLKKLLT